MEDQAKSIRFINNDDQTSIWDIDSSKTNLVKFPWALNLENNRNSSWEHELKEIIIFDNDNNPHSIYKNSKYNK
jgi:Zn-dependent peptidase ImmA (M78 family)